MQFTGRFAPATLGIHTASLPIAGKGTITATEEGLVVEGYRPRSAEPAIVLWMLVVCATVFATAALLPDHGDFAKWLGVGVGAATYRLAFGWRRAGKRRVRLSYSWHQYGSAALTDEGRSVVIEISGKGTLYFRPDIAADAMLLQLEHGPSIDDEERTNAIDLWQEPELTESSRFRS